MTCLNCSTETKGHYCHECGQKTESHRITIKGLIKDFFFSAFHLEKKGLPSTIMRLTLKPGSSVREYLQGQRQSLYPPFKYLVLVGAIVVIFSLRYQFFSNEYTQVETKSESSLADFIFIPAEHHEFVENFFKFAEDEATLLNVAAIPVFALFSFIVLAGRQYNFAENLILNTFITAQQLFFLLLLIPFYEFLPQSKTLLIGIYTIGVILYNTWVYIEFFGLKISTLFKSITVVLLAYIYQFPVNFLVYFVYERYIHHHMHWIPKVYDNIVS